MKAVFSVFIVLALLFGAQKSQANRVVRDCIVAPKKYITASEPLEFPRPYKVSRANNLIKLSNDLFCAQGQQIILEGYIIDRNGVPVNNAVVEIWQRNAFGVFQHDMKPKHLIKNDPCGLDFFDPHFSSTGTSLTDNTGFYRFLTIMPNSLVACKPDLPPKINLAVRIPLRGECLYTTGLPLPKTMKIEDRNGCGVYRFDVVLDRCSKFRKF